MELRRRIVLVLAGWLVLASVGSAQTPTATAAISPPPHYAGVPVQIQLAVVGFEESPAPEVEVEPPPGVRLEQVSVSPQISTSIRIENGQVSRSHEVRFIVRLRAISERSGRIAIGPFTLRQGARTATAPAVTLEAGTVPESGTQSIALQLPDRPLWVGERVPVTVEWAVEETLAARVAGHRARVPLFDRLDLFRFEEPAARGSRATLRLETGGGTRELPATLRREERNGKSLVVLSVTRDMIPLTAGTVEVDAPDIVVDEAVRWQRNVFNERVVTDVRQIRARGERQTLDVRIPPAAGRPASFAGIIGSGFSLSVSAERSVVSVGDPIELTVDVRGDGALDTLSLPDFRGLGLDPADFSVPGAPVAGRTDGSGGKRFRFSVRPLHAGVNAVPALELAWFDPRTGRYETTRSDPVALSVNPARVVGAGDVVVRQSRGRGSAARAADGAAGGASGAPAPSPLGESTRTDSATSSGAAARADGTAPAAGRASDGLAAEGPGAPSGTSAPVAAFTDLAVETRLGRLATPARAWYAQDAVQIAGYAAAGLLLAGALGWRRYRDADPAARALRQSLLRERNTIRDARDAEQIGRGLRALVARAGSPRERERFDAVLADCDALTFGRAPAPPEQFGQLRAQALALADQLVAAARVPA